MTVRVQEASRSTPKIVAPIGSIYHVCWLDPSKLLRKECTHPPFELCSTCRSKNPESIAVQIRS